MRTYSKPTIRATKGRWQLYVKCREADDEPWQTLTKMTDIPADRGRGKRAAEEEALAWRDGLIVSDVVAEMQDRFETRLREELGRSRGGSPRLDLTLEEYATEFVTKRRLGRSTGRPLEASSRMGYESLLRNQILALMPEGVTVRQVTPDMVESMVWRLQAERGYAPSTVRKAFNLLSATMSFACERDGLERNPCAAVTPPQKGRPRANSLSVEGARELAKELARLEPSRGVTAGRLALACGMRCGELAALRIGSCGIADGLLRVESTLSVGADAGYGSSSGPASYHLKAPKTAAGLRAIPLNDEMRAAILPRIELMRSACEREGTRFSDALFLLGHPNGSWTAPRDLSGEWSSVSRALGVRGMLGKRVTLHDLRHTFATYALAQGAHVKDVQAILGHSAASMTLDVYAGSDPMERLDAMRRISKG